MNTIPEKTLGTKWVIPHPGTLKPIECQSFEEAMEKWFEGFNVPVLWVDGVAEPWETSYGRTSKYFG